MEFLNFDWRGKRLKLRPEVGAFYTGNMAILLYDWSSGRPEPWYHLTVNTHLICPPNCTLINTDLLGDEILTWISEQHLAAPTGRFVGAGDCMYREYRFDPQALQRFDPEGYRKYLSYLLRD